MNLNLVAANIIENDENIGINQTENTICTRKMGCMCV